MPTKNNTNLIDIEDLKVLLDSPTEALKTYVENEIGKSKETIESKVKKGLKETYGFKFVVMYSVATVLSIVIIGLGSHLYLNKANMSDLAKFEERHDKNAGELKEYLKDFVKESKLNRQIQDNNIKELQSKSYASEAESKLIIEKFDRLKEVWQSIRTQGAR